MAAPLPNSVVQPAPSTGATSTSAPNMLQPGVDPLDFSDIFSFSVSPHLRDNHMNLDLPAQPTSTEGAGGAEEDTFEPPDAAEIQQMREKLFAMGIVDPATSTSKDSITRSIDIGQRERQLAEMVLRLTHPSLHPQPSQLIEQAATISQLTRQRDFLIQCHQEEREFWEAERESWVRIAGALTARRLNDGSHRTDIVERDNLNLMSDNRLLKMKLQEQQSRVENLEMELRMLRPLLLLRPASPPRNTGQPTSTRPAGRPRKAKEKDQSRFSDDDLDLHHAKRGHNPLKYASTGDARSEHLLLATRKLGKQKITSLLPSAAFPQGSSGSLGIAFNPARPNGVTPTVAPPPHPQSPQISQSVPSASLQVPTTSRSVSGPTTRPTQPSTPGASLGALARHHSTLTPRTPRQGRRISPQRVSRANPDKLVTPSHPHTATIPGSNTPSALDHLIQASRILGANGGGEESPSHSSVDGSPLKRRRVEEGSPNEGRGEASSSTGVGRMMSALDVLAEQAAVVISQSPQKHPREGSRSDIESEDELYTVPEEPSRLPEAPSVPPPSKPHAQRKGKGKQQRPREGSQASRVSGTSSNLKSPILIQPPPTLGGEPTVPELDLDARSTHRVRSAAAKKQQNTPRRSLSPGSESDGQSTPRQQTPATLPETS